MAGILKIALYLRSNLKNVMKLLIVTLFCLICSSYIDDAAAVCSDRTADEVSAAISATCSDHSIDAPEQNIILPRQINLATHTQTRTVGQRNITQKYQFRYIFFISGKAVDKSFVETYQSLFRYFSSSLMTPFWHHLSLGRLII